MEWECKGCGEILEITDGQKTAVCDFCGMENTLPSMDSEEKMQELIRANVDRVACKFDVAKKQYEKIIEKYPDDNEAYWCKLLCVYGIEYVEDASTERRIPTCHRTLKESIFDNKDYKLIMSRATKEEKAIYEAEAKEIDRIQKEILANATNQQPYDIFICYKESDNNGRRTRDSQTASKIYNNLTDKGYKVFFAKVTLKELAGNKYEPIIYSALTSAKVMLVVTSSKEFVNAPWVRNEWSRFLEFMQSDYSKTIVPCISIMDAYDLPEELAEFQALNTQDMDFTESLTRQIDSKFGKTTVNKTPENVTVTQARSGENATSEAQPTSVSPISKYLERIEIFLQDKEWAEADAYAEKVLDLDPKCVEAYLGKLLAELQVSKKENLKNCKLPFDKAKNYPKVLRYADAELKAFLENSIQYIKERNETDRKEEIYKKAVATMNGAVTEKDFKSAGEKFKTILEYKDAKILSDKCYEKAEAVCKNSIYVQAQEVAKGNSISDYEKAIELYKSIIDWKDSKAKIKYYKNIIANLKTKMDEDRKSADQEENRCRQLINDLKTLNNKERIEKEIKEIEKKISSLADEGSQLGFFAMKRKKEIEEEIRLLEIKKKEKLIEKGSLDVARLKGLTEEEIILALRKTAIGEKLYSEYNEEKLKDQKTRKLMDVFQIDRRTAESKALEVGSTVKFGKYYQSNSKTKEDIEWQVIEKVGHRALLISKYALEYMLCCGRYENETWGTCKLRKWLNDEFLNTAFTAVERTFIQTKFLTDTDNPKYRTRPGSATQDKVFLLSISEANKYFSTNLKRQCKKTKYVKQKGWVSGNYEYCWWWLRSPGEKYGYFAFVNREGFIDYAGEHGYLTSNAVRPALWVNLES